jgi:inner membrane transporter RhtA
MFFVPLRLRPFAAAGLVLCGSLSVQLSAALASRLFGSVGTLGVSGLRMAIAAALLLIVVRPRLRGRSPRHWAAIALYGIAMAAMNVLFYGAVDRLPLGLAVTLEFLGPLSVAAVATARRWELLLPALTLAGVILISRPGGGMTAVGLLFGLGAAAAFGAYTVLAAKVGDEEASFDALALSVTVGAIVLTPFSIPASAHVHDGGWLVLAASGVLGVALAFACDFTATRLTSPRVVGTLFAMDPVIASLTGLLALHQALGLGEIAGMVLIAGSGAAVIALAGGAADSRDAADQVSSAAR